MGVAADSSNFTLGRRPERVRRLGSRSSGVGGRAGGGSAGHRAELHEDAAKHTDPR